MRTVLPLLLLLHLSLSAAAQSPANPVMHLFPEGTRLHGNIPYLEDTLSKHLLDIYLPAQPQGKVPLVIWVHGGGWLSNDKYADMAYMKGTVAAILQQGYALASIDYRFSTQAVFPAQMIDCNAAVAYLFDHAERYGFDLDRVALMGFSAGGHLAAMIGLANNNQIDEFFHDEVSRKFDFKGVVNFYGPADLTLFPGADDARSPEGMLIGAAPLDRPDLAKAASPVTYVDADDPPFLLIHGELDNLVSPRHTRLLSSWLEVHGVQQEMIVVPGAPHFGPMFDAAEIRQRVMGFLEERFK